MAYEPNSLAGGCPFHAGAAGFVSFPQQVKEDKVRGKPEKFADHYTQATLFYESQAPWEQQRIVAAFRFELSKLTMPAIRERMVASLRNVNEDLAAQVAEGLGLDLPDPLPRVLERPATPEVTVSPALSLTALPGETGVRTRKVAILVANGVDGDSLTVTHAALVGAGAVPRFVGPRLGGYTTAGGGRIEADASMENAPDVLFDALVRPDGEAGVRALAADPHTREFVANQFRHGKTILAFGASRTLLERAGVPTASPDGGLLLVPTTQANAPRKFIEAMTERQRGRE